jgi:hypothetical protein
VNGVVARSARDASAGGARARARTSPLGLSKRTAAPQ